MSDSILLPSKSKDTGITQAFSKYYTNGKGVYVEAHFNAEGVVWYTTDEIGRRQARMGFDPTPTSNVKHDSIYDFEKKMSDLCFYERNWMPEEPSHYTRPIYVLEVEHPKAQKEQ